MATIKDVAKLAGVSICTVSRALANKNNIKPQTRERILAAAEALDYKPNFAARSLKSGNTDTLGLIVPDITNPYYPKVAKSIEEYAGKQGYMILLCNANENLEKEKRLVETLSERNVDGVIALPCSRQIAHIQRLARSGIPYVFLNRSFPGEPHCIPSDNFFGAYTMTKYLLEKGHRKISAAFLSFDNPIYRERYEGTLAALKEYGLERCAETFFFDVPSMQDFYYKMLALLRGKDRPTALAAANDMLCIGAYSAANTCGLKIPEDLSVTGYDNIQYAEMMMPPLTSFLQSEDELAQVGVDYLLELIAGGQPSPPEQLRGEMIVRQSVCPPKLDRAP